MSNMITMSRPPEPPAAPPPAVAGLRSPSRAPTTASVGITAAVIQRHGCWETRRDHERGYCCCPHTRRGGGGGGLRLPLPTACQLCETDQTGGQAASPGGGTTVDNTPGRISGGEGRLMRRSKKFIPRPAAQVVHSSAPCKASGGYLDADRGASEDTTAGGNSWRSETISCDCDAAPQLPVMTALKSPEWANSDPPIKRPEGFPKTKLFLPVPIRPVQGFLCNQVLTDTEVPSYGLSPVSVPGEDTPVDQEAVAAFDRLRFMAIGISETSGVHVRLHYGDRKLVNSNSEEYKTQVTELRQRWAPENCPIRRKTRRYHSRSTTFDGLESGLAIGMSGPLWPASARYGGGSASQRYSGVTTGRNKRATIGRRGRSPNGDQLRQRSTATMGILGYNRRHRKQQVKSLMQGGGGGGRSRRASSTGPIYSRGLPIGTTAAPCVGDSDVARDRYSTNLSSCRLF